MSVFSRSPFSWLCDPSRSGDRGYAMAALLVGISVMTIMLSMALPVWRTAVKREREAELVFRGEQYAHAIELFSRRNGGFPPSLDVLVQGRYIRKLYKDPMTGEGDFQPLYFGQPLPGQTAAPRAGRSWGTGWGTARTATRTTTRDAARWPCRPAGVHRRRSHHRRRQQEHGRVAAAVQRQRPLQRVGVRGHRRDDAAWSAGRRAEPRSRARRRGALHGVCPVVEAWGSGKVYRVGAQGRLHAGVAAAVRGLV